LHHRPVDQTADWRQVVMDAEGESKFAATIPHSEIVSLFDHMYYFQVDCEDGSRLWPSWEQGPPYLVIAVAPD
jgi:hypothetical protein